MKRRKREHPASLFKNSTCLKKYLVQLQAEAGSEEAAAARFLAKYSSARARFLATEGLTHFLRPGRTVSEQPTCSSFSFADVENARAFMVNFLLSSPSPRICNQSVINKYTNSFFCISNVLCPCFVNT